MAEVLIGMGYFGICRFDSKVAIAPENLRRLECIAYTICIH